MAHAKQSKFYDIYVCLLLLYYTVVLEHDYSIMVLESSILNESHSQDFVSQSTRSYLNGLHLQLHLDFTGKLKHYWC